MRSEDKISDHITYHEATFSEVAARKKIRNIPDEGTLYRMKIVAEECFEPLRKWYGKPIKINSFFRCRELNKAVGGSTTSQHMTGQAIDITAGSKEENRKLYNWAKENLIYDQLINEYDYSWVHISFCHKYNRNQAFAIV